MLQRTLKIAAVVGVIAIVGVGALAVVPEGRETLRSIKLLRDARFFVYNLRHQPPEPRELGDGDAAVGLLLASPSALAGDGDKILYLADRHHRVVWQLMPDGKAHLAVGTGRRGDASEGLATEVDLGTAEGLALGPDGRLHFADAYNHVVLRLEPDGRLVRVAGTGLRGYDGDGRPARDSRLNLPYDLAFDQEGNLYIADFDNHRIRKVAADGTIETVAGTGAPGYAGDGGPAIEARLKGPYGVTVDRAGRVLIADSFNHVVRRIEADGTIATIAGTGEMGYGGDGGPAEEALLNAPESLHLDADGRLLIGDEHNNVIRMVDLEGKISTLVGDRATDGGPAPVVREPLSDPEDMLQLDDGSLLLADRGHHRLLRITPAGKVELVAGRNARAPLASTKSFQNRVGAGILPAITRK